MLYISSTDHGGGPKQKETQRTKEEEKIADGVTKFRYAQKCQCRLHSHTQPRFDIVSTLPRSEQQHCRPIGCLGIASWLTQMHLQTQALRGRRSRWLPILPQLLEFKLLSVDRERRPFRRGINKRAFGHGQKHYVLEQKLKSPKHTNCAVQKLRVLRTV